MLRWSINLFRLFGIQLAVHPTFVLLLTYFGINGWRHGGLDDAPGGFVGMFWGVFLILAYFCCVVLHELGHSLTARRYGIRVPRILLLPIGGMAEFDRIPREPRAELLITLAGPAVNFVIFAVLVPFIWHPLFADEEIALMSWSGFIVQLAIANLVMGVFNLLPVFPMDGGRIFRALLAMKLPYLRATYWAAMVGKVLAPVFALVAMYFHAYLLALLFAFIFVVGDSEYRLLLLREREAANWTEMARRVSLVVPPAAEPEPPLLLHGPN